MLNEVQVIKMVHAKQVKKQKGASMIEYALVVAAVVAIGALIFDGTADSLDGAIEAKVGKIAESLS
jgi:Flp pilus assembly pilin Flp